MTKDIIREIKSGNKEAFEDLYNKYADYALRVAFAVTRSNANAADAVQETFIRINSNIDTFKDENPFDPWFYKILINECRRVLKINSIKNSSMDIMANDLYLSVNRTPKFEEYEDLYFAIEKLDEINRIPIILKYLKGFSEKDISHILSLNINTVKSRLYKGRLKLKNFLKVFDEGWSDYEG
ncbi:RNA polymerase sigma factor [Clostridium sp. D2Q-11]|uniref:RNA polymerase sigma factor n=1 Tax=Anaeromonas frigoriresistens TaxID=2683708 RepID=A0A942UWG5_9FIRM|nr:RNA polymerase sigma factor [Anaeromonas frigoriresistens]MBS4538810.1 RNA polymerase sigma factor [Anaeromonas frigoriresistens]